MRIDCLWVSTNLEAIFSDGLAAEDARLARSHIQECSTCRTEIEGLEEVDLLVKKYFRHECAAAHAPKRHRLAWARVGAAAALAVALVFAVSLRPQQIQPDLAPAADQAIAATGTAAEPELEKNPESDATQRAKPEAATTAPGAGPGAPALSTAGPAGVGIDAPDFLIVDPAGYFRTLEDYRGHVLLFGVWATDQPEAIASIERIYRNFGSNPKLRIIGVANQRQGPPANATFPLFYNQGSRLLNARSGEFVLLDEAGSIRARGSLLTQSDNLIKLLSEALQPLAIQ